MGVVGGGVAKCMYICAQLLGVSLSILSVMTALSDVRHSHDWDSSQVDRRR